MRELRFKTSKEETKIIIIKEISERKQKDNCIK